MTGGFEEPLDQMPCYTLTNMVTAGPISLLHQRAQGQFEPQGFEPKSEGGALLRTITLRLL